MKKLETAKQMLLSGESLALVQYATGISRNDIISKTNVRYDKINKRWYDDKQVGIKSDQWNNKEFFLNKT